MKNTKFLKEATLHSNFKSGNALMVNIPCPKVSQNYAISFVRNNYLNTNTDISMKILSDVQNERRSWVNVIALCNIDILLMNHRALIKQVIF